jgi:hypothetical protein
MINERLPRRHHTAKLSVIYLDIIEVGFLRWGELAAIVDGHGSSPCRPVSLAAT